MLWVRTIQEPLHEQKVRKKYMKYVDILELIKKEGGQPLPVWTTFAESESGYQNNGMWPFQTHSRSTILIKLIKYLT